MKRSWVFRAALAGLLSALTIPFMGCGVVGVYAQQQDPTLKYSGSNVATTIDLTPGSSTPTVTDEELLAGEGELGSFTYRELHADYGSSSSSCTGLGYFTLVTGFGVFNFSDGSLLTVNMTQGSICIDNAGLGHLSETYQITGGTGRFQGASGTLTLTGILSVIGSDTEGNPKLLTNTGEFQGTISK
jgi:hypothetical protein